GAPAAAGGHDPVRRARACVPRRSGCGGCGKTGPGGWHARGGPRALARPISPGFQGTCARATDEIETSGRIVIRTWWAHMVSRARRLAMVGSTPHKTSPKGRFLKWFLGERGAHWATDPGEYNASAVEETVSSMGRLFGDGCYFGLQIQGWE